MKHTDVGNISKKDDVLSLYNGLIKNGYSSEDLGDEKTFRKKMSDGNNRKVLYDWVLSNGDSLGDYETYEKRLSNQYSQGLVSENDFYRTGNGREPQTNISHGGIGTQEEADSVFDANMRRFQEGKPIERVNLNNAARNAKPYGNVSGGQTTHWGNTNHDWRPDEQKVVEGIARSENATIAKDEQGNEYYPVKPMEVAFDEGLQQEKKRIQALATVGEQLDNRIKANEEALKEAYDKRESSMNRGNSFVFGAGASSAPKVNTDAYDETIKNLIAEQDYLTNSKKLYEAAKNDAGFFSGMKDAVDASFLTFGVSDLHNAERISNVQRKLESGQPLSESEQSLLTSLGLQQIVNEQYNELLGSWYKAGMTTTDMVPFMAEMAVSPLSGLGKTAMKASIKKFGEKGAKAIASKILSRTIGDVAGAAGMAVTTGMPSVMADALERQQGYVTTDTSSGVVEGTGLVGGESASDAWRKAITSRTIENWSEMVGNYFAPVGQAAGKVTTKTLNALKLGKVNEIIDNINSSNLARILDDFTEQTQWNGSLGEFAEEQVGMIADAVLVGDTKWSDITDFEQQLDVALGVGVFGSFMSILRMGGYRTPKYRAQKAVEKADENGLNLFGTDWRNVKELILASPDEELSANLAAHTEFSTEQMKAAMMYANALKTQQAVNTYKEKVKIENPGNVSEDDIADDNIVKESENKFQAKEKGRSVYASGDLNAMREAVLREEVSRERLESAGLAEDVVLELMEADDIHRVEILESMDEETRELAEDFLHQHDKRQAMEDAMNEYHAPEVKDAKTRVAQMSPTGRVAVVPLGSHGDAEHTHGVIVNGLDGQGNSTIEGNIVMVVPLENMGGKPYLGSFDFDSEGATAIRLGNLDDVVYMDPNAVLKSMLGHYSSEVNAIGEKPIMAGGTYSIVLPSGEMTSIQIQGQDSEGYWHFIQQESGTPGYVPEEDLRSMINAGERAPIMEEYAKADAEKQATMETVDMESMKERYSPEVMALTPQNGEKIETEKGVGVIMGEADGGYVVEYKNDKGVSVATEVITKDDYYKYKQASYDALRNANKESTVSVQENDALQESGEPASNKGGMSEDVAQTQEVEQTSTIPIKKDGSIDFVVYGKDNTFRVLGDKYGEKMPHKIEVTSKALAKDLKKAQQKLEKAEEDYDNAPIGREDKAEKARDKAREEFEAVKREADFWAEMDAEIKSAQVMPGDEAADEILSMEEPLNGLEFAAQMLANGNIKLLQESFMEETGFGREEAKKYFGLFASKEKGGVSVERAGERLMEADREEGTNFFDQNDANAGRDAIIEILGIARTKSDLANYIKDNREKQARKEQAAEYAVYESWVEENFHMSIQDYEAYEEVIARELSERALTEEEYQEFMSTFVDETINNEQYEQQGIDSESEGSSEILPGTQSLQAERTGGIEEESAEVDGGIVDENGALSESSSGNEVVSQIEQARAEVDTNPTDAQKEAGNYKKGHVKIDGFDITIENPKGGVRSGTDKNGKKWSITMNNDYGYIRGTEAVDGDHIDVFLSDNPTEGNVFVVDQSNEDGSFDESKVMYGFNSMEEARAAYLSNYNKGWESRIMAITEVSKDEFKKWIDSSHRKTKAFSEYKSVKAERPEGPSIEESNISRMQDIENRLAEIEDRKIEIEDLKKDRNIGRLALAQLLFEEKQLGIEQTDLEAEYKGLRSMNDESNAILESEGESPRFKSSYKLKESLRRKPLRNRIKEWEDKLGVKINIMESLKDVSNVSARKAILSEKKVTGWYDVKTKEVSFFLPYIESIEEIDATFVHEVVAHEGLRGLLGDKFDKFCDEVWEMMSAADKAEYIKYPGVNGDTRAAADEYIAHLAETIDVTDSAWSKFTELIKKFLKVIGLEPKMTNADIANTIKLSYQRLAEGVGAENAGVGTRFRTLDEINETFNDELQQQIDGTLLQGHIYQLGSPSAILLSTGIADVPIQLNSARLEDKSKNFGHDYDLSELKDLVKAIHNPMAIFAYGNKNKAQNIIVEIQHEGKNFIVGLSIRPSVGGQVLNINSIRNVFPKDNAEWLNWISQDKLLYADKERIQNLINQQRTNLADVDYLDLDSIANIVKDFQNPTIPEEKSRFRVVYHGSHASFDKFDHSFMSTGEGNQVYGWGTYVTEVEGIGRQYANIYAKNSPLASSALRWIEENGTYDDFLAQGEGKRRNWAIRHAKDYLKELKEEGASEDVIKAYEQDLVDAENALSEENYNRTKGNMIASLNRNLYTVDIPDNDGTNYIEWDKPLSEDNKKRIKDAVLNSRMYKDYASKYGEDVSLERLNSWLNAFDAGRVYRLLENFADNEDGKESAKQISLLLSDAGFTGFEYPANYLSGGNLEGAKNYVIFNEHDLGIVEHTRFRAVKDKNGKETLVGLHNISESKLRKTIKQGGLANPSMAVIDIDNQKHVDYGEITLVAPADLIDKKAGKNIGTYLADAYTPVYPTVTKQMSNKGKKTFTKALESVDETFRNRIRLYFNNYLDSGTMYDALFYWYLSDTGKNPPILESALPDGYTREEVKKIKSVNPDATIFAELSEEDRRKVIDLYVEREGGKEKYEDDLAKRVEGWKKSIEDENALQMRKKFSQDKLNELDEYGYEYSRIANYYSYVIHLANASSKPSEIETFRNAYDEVVKNGLEEDFGNWLMGKEKELGVEEKLFAGYDNQGRAKYLPNTLENASKLIKKEGRAGATGLGGFNYFVAILAPVAKTTKQIKAKKDNLSTQEEYDDFAKKWSGYYHNLALQLQPGADKWADYGYHRLHEIAPMANPKEYVKKEYGIELSDKFIKDLNDVKNAIKNDFPARYFETKFERPVYLNEFAAAVVPEGTSKDIVSALSEAGLPVEQYEKDNNEARMAAVDKVSSEIGGIRFRIANRNQEIFVSNAAKAVEGIKQEKATPQQWLAMIEKNGGLKAGEDKWLGLSDWLKDSKVKSITKDEILNFINENKIVIEEVKYGGVGFADEWYEEDVYDTVSKSVGDYKGIEFRDSFMDAFEFEYDDYVERVRAEILNDEQSLFLYNEANGENLELDEEGYIPRRYVNKVKVWAEDVVSESMKPIDKDKPINSTRLKYTTEGLENKQEIALTVPTIEPWNESDEIHFGDAGEGRAVAWIRFGETEDSEGNKTLVIDEIQSKRHQEGREKGYKSQADKTPARMEDLTFGKYNGLTTATYKGERLYFSKDKTKEEILEMINERIAEGQLGSANNLIPDAPFEKNWHELAMKRMLRYAAENGYDKVAWTKGAQQAERYNIGGAVESIDYFLRGDGAYRVVTYGKNGYQIGSVPIEYKDGQALSEVFGKELATKMVKDLEEDKEKVEEALKAKKDIRDKMRGMDEDSAEYEALLIEFGKYDSIQREADKGHSISGDGLRIGGEGMKGFYDEILPRFVNKYVKKWGTKVQDFELPNVEEAGQIMHSVDVTDAMKESVMQGQIMFRVNGRRMNKIHSGIEDFTNKYNSAPIHVLSDNTTDEEVRRWVGFNDIYARDFVNWMDDEKSSAVHSSLTGEIIIFADRIKPKKIEKTLFHENLHSSLRDRNHDELVGKFYKSAKDDERFGKWRKLSDKYPEAEKAEEFFAYVVSNKMKEGNLEEVLIHLIGEEQNELFNILKGIGYEYEQERHRRTTQTGKGGGRYSVRNSDVQPMVGTETQGSGSQEEGRRGRSKEEAERLKQLFDKVADMGLDGVLGNEAYDAAMVDMYEALPEDARNSVEADAKKHYDGNRIPAMSDYLIKAKADIIDKIIGIIRNALRKAGFDITISEGDVKYLLWRSKKPLDRYSRISMAEDVYNRYRLNTGVTSAGVRFREKRPQIVQGYDNKIASQAFKFREAFQDSMLSLKVLMETIEDATGKKAKSFENAYTAENRLSSINKVDNEKYIEGFLAPLMQEVKKLSDKYGQKTVENYIYAKSGLERNEVLKTRDADKLFNEAMEELDEKLRKGDITDDQYDYYKTNEEIKRQESLNEEVDYAGLRGLLFNTKVEELEHQLDNGDISKAEYDRQIKNLEENKEDLEKEFKSFAETIVGQFEQQAGDEAVNALWEKINAATNETLKKDFESGMIGEETYEATKNMMKYYVPLRGWYDKTAEQVYDYSHVSSPIQRNQKQAEGRWSQSENPIVSIAQMAQNAIVRGNRNKMKQRLFNFVVNRPTELATFKEGWYVKDPTTGGFMVEYPDIEETDTAQDIQRKLDEFEVRMQELEKDKKAFKGRLPFGVPFRVNKKQKSEHIVPVMINGREYGIYINGNPRAAQAMNGMTNPEASNKLSEYYDIVKRFYSAGLTSWNPDFMIANAVRDSIHSSTMVFLEKGPMAAAYFLKDIPKSVRTIRAEIFGKGTSDPQMKQYFEEFVNYGGETGYTAIHTLEDYKKEYEKVLANLKGWRKQVGKAKEGLSAIAKWMEQANRMFEDINRFNAYQSSRRSGKSIEESVDAAKNITVNFNKKGAGFNTKGFWGSLAGVMSKWILFFNPTVQGITQILRAKKVSPRRFNALLGTVFGSGIIVPFLNSMLVGMMGDDEDEYWNQNDYTRMNNMLLFNPIGGGYFKIPLPPTFREIYGMGDILYRMLTGRITPERAAVSTLRQAQLLTGFINMIPDEEPDLGKALLGLAPDVLAPLTDVIVNQDFTGRKIAKVTDYNKHDPEFKRIYKGVSPMYVTLSQWINEMGGDEVSRAPLFGTFINPAYMEHIITGYSGGIGRTLSNVAGFVADAVNGEFHENFDMRKVPIVSRFYQTADEKTVSSSVNRRYREYEAKFEKLEHDYKGYQKKVREGAVEFQKEIDRMEENGEKAFMDFFRRKSKALRKKQERLKKDPENKRLEQEITELKAEIALGCYEALK